MMFTQAQVALARRGLEMSSMIRDGSVATICRRKGKGREGKFAVVGFDSFGSGGNGGGARELRAGGGVLDG